MICFHLKWLKVNHTPQRRAIQVFQIIIQCSCMHRHTVTHACMYGCVRVYCTDVIRVCAHRYACACVCFSRFARLHLYLSVEMCVNRRAGKNLSCVRVFVRKAIANKQRTRQTARNIPQSIRIKSHCIFVITMSFVLIDHYRIDFNFKRFS